MRQKANGAGRPGKDAAWGLCALADHFLLCVSTLESHSDHVFLTIDGHGVP